MPDGKQNPTAVAALEAALPGLRPELHRYCARMTGSVIDGEDVLQETLLKATRALRDGTSVGDLRAWLFGIAHNVAVGLFRTRDRETAMKKAIADITGPSEEMPTCGGVADVLRPFLDLTPRQRSAVILRDVLGYSAAQVADLTDSSVQSVKSALHRGRAVLRQSRSQDAPRVLPEQQRRALARYAACFNAHEFDCLREMLTEEVRLDLVARQQRTGRAAVGGYFGNYRKQRDWRMAPGSVEGRPAILAFDRQDPAGQPRYFILLEFRDALVLSIRDFRYARYVMADTCWERFGP